MNNEPVAWMPVIGFENQYEVSNTGDIKNVKSGRILAKSIMGSGYYKADLWSFGKRRQTSIHRVVAGAFLGIPVDGMEVNHKDGNKLNNHVSNLEWVTKSENEQHSREVLGNLCKPVKAICLKTGEVRIYPSQTATAMDGFEPKCVSDICLKKDRYTHKGWAFEYYTHPAKPIKDREADRKRFSDEGFNRWLDESISDSGHTVYDLVENVCEAWHGWENSQYYKPAKTLTDEEILNVAFCSEVSTVAIENDWDGTVIEFARAILRKAQEK